MQGEYISKLKDFASGVNGAISYDQHPTKTLRKGGWSRLAIRIEHPKTPLFFIAFSGTNSAEVYSGFYAVSKLPSDTRCTIIQRDPYFDFFHRFKRKKMKSGRPAFDKTLSVYCNNKYFLDKLTTDHDVASFLEKSIRLPIRFEVKPIDKNLLTENGQKSTMITINSNEWIVDASVLQKLFKGFSKIADRFC